MLSRATKNGAIKVVLQTPDGSTAPISFAFRQNGLKAQ